MTYIACSDCGHRALSVATRCPHCRVAFPARPLQRPEAGRSRDSPSALLAGAIVTGAVVAVVALKRPARSGAHQRLGTTVSQPAPTGVPSSRNGPGIPAMSRAARSDGPQAPAAPEPRSGVTRYARTWVNVRDDRAQAAPSVRVLNPGERVMVDSLRDGWYRVLAAGRALGYVHRSNLDAGPPTGRP